MKKDKIIALASNFRLKIKAILTKAIEGKKLTKKFRWIPVCDLSKYMMFTDLIIDGKLNEARKVLDFMDTAAYEEIPRKLYDIIDHGKWEQ